MDIPEAREIFYGTMKDLRECGEDLSTAHGSANKAAEDAKVVKALAEELGTLIVSALLSIEEGSEAFYNYTVKCEEAHAALENAGLGEHQATQDIIGPLLDVLDTGRDTLDTLLLGGGSLAQLLEERIIPLKANGTELSHTSNDVKYHLLESRQGISIARTVGWNYGDFDL